MGVTSGSWAGASLRSIAKPRHSFTAHTPEMSCGRDTAAALRRRSAVLEATAAEKAAQRDHRAALVESIVAEVWDAEVRACRTFATILLSIGSATTLRM